MQESYDFKVVEPTIARLWEDARCFEHKGNGRPYSMFFMPPNASGPLHIGNALMLAIQDVLARHHRAKGEPTLWVPGSDHGGYETQVTYEQETGQDASAHSKKEQRKAIAAFVERNNGTIVRQTKELGASVDWRHFRYTLDDGSLVFVNRMFSKMVKDDLIYRNSYMVNFCPECATVLADIELKEVGEPAQLYFVKFPFKNGDGHLTLATPKPEFLFSVTHILVQPQDQRYSGYIGIELVNPTTGKDVLVVESKRKFDPEHAEAHLLAFMPSIKKYDFEYAIRHKLPAHNLLDWDGRLTERHPGLTPEEAGAKELAYLEETGALERSEEVVEPVYYCKKRHLVQTVIRMTWFLDFDNERVPLREMTLRAIDKERPLIYPHWRQKGLVEWIGKMHDWPIARQNAWGIQIPVWYEVSDPALFMVWFYDRAGVRRFGNLQKILDEGITFDEVVAGLDQVYAAEGARWSLERKEGGRYLPETDTFDTWFSSCAWGPIVFEPKEVARFYPSAVNVLGYDLLRLFTARHLMLGVYLTGELPSKRVFFHALIQSKDGQKMSKSLGNAVTLDHYVGTYGADVTRLALVSYTASFRDFHIEDARLEYFSNFAQRLWQMGRVCELSKVHNIPGAVEAPLIEEVRALRTKLSGSLDKYLLAQAQEQGVAFLGRLEEYIHVLRHDDNAEHAVAVLNAAFKTYLEVLHPFMPFMTEALYKEIYRPETPLASIETKK